MKIKNLLAGVAVAGLVSFGVPSAAQAYVPVPPVEPPIITPLPPSIFQNFLPSYFVTPGNIFSIFWPAGVFAPGSDVLVTLTGNQFAVFFRVGPFASIGSAPTSSTTATLVSDAEGGLRANITVPEDAEGTFTLTAVDETGRAAPPITVEVAAEESDGSLPATGGTGSLPALAAGGGLLAVGALAVVVARSRRREGAA